MSKLSKRIRRGKRTKAVQRDAIRLVVSKSNQHIYAQIVHDAVGGNKVLVSCSTLNPEIRKTETGNKVDQARAVGRVVGRLAIEKGLKAISFDRNGYRYHGRVKALAEGAREADLDF